MDEVAPAAFHNSAQRIHAPRCHANTRGGVLNVAFSPLVQASHGKTCLAWVHGAAGAGKTAILQTFAEMCIERGIWVASFFFCRLDPSRSTIAPVVATLAYQIMRLIPSIKPAIMQAIVANPLVFTMSFDTQMEELIIQPLLRIKHDRAHERLKLVIVIDALDECEGEINQRYLVRSLGQLLSSRNLPLYVLISSRSEFHLRLAFENLHCVSDALFIPLDDHETFQPRADILTYLNDSLSSIRRTHPFRHCLPPDWPPQYLIQHIADRASGQFMYAAVVVDFISGAGASPASQLDIIARLAPSRRSSPFTSQLEGLPGSLPPERLTAFKPLDTLYRHIFSLVRKANIETTMKYLAYILLTKEENPAARISAFFDIRGPDAVFAAFAPLASVVECGHERFRFLHESLSDFLTDKARSFDYYIDCGRWGTCFAIAWYEAYALHTFAASGCEDILHFLKHAQPTPELRARISAFDSTKCLNFISVSADRYLSVVGNLDFGDGGTLYREQVSNIYRVIDRVFPHLSRHHRVHRAMYRLSGACST